MKEHEEKKDRRRKRKEDGLEKKARTKTARRKNRNENTRVQKLGQFKLYVACSCLLQGKLTVSQSNTCLQRRCMAARPVLGGVRGLRKKPDTQLPHSMKCHCQCRLILHRVIPAVQLGNAIHHNPVHCPLLRPPPPNEPMHPSRSSVSHCSCTLITRKGKKRKSTQVKRRQSWLGKISRSSDGARSRNPSTTLFPDALITR